MKQTKTTIYDVAEAAGTSISTVSHVLNKTRYVSDETTQRVLKAVDDLGYRPSSLARAMVRNETRTIGLIVPDNTNPFFAELAHAIEEAGFGAGYNVLLCNAVQDPVRERAYVEMLIDKHVDGVIFMMTDMGEAATSADSADPDMANLQRFARNRIPVVTFDREYNDVDTVLLDNPGGGYLAATHLIELGHTSIACIMGPNEATGSRSRVDGYQAALSDAGIAQRPELIVRGDWTCESGKKAADQLLNLSSPPTAIFACNDAMAIGTVSALYRHGYRVPDGVSVVGFDDIMLSRYSTPPLTTIRTPIAEVGLRMAHLLLNRIAGESPGEAQRHCVEAELIIRDTTAPPPKPSAT